MGEGPDTAVAGEVAEQRGRRERRRDLFRSALLPDRLGAPMAPPP